MCKASNKNNFYKLVRNEIREYFKGMSGFTWSMEYKNNNNKLIQRQELLDVCIFIQILVGLQSDKH